MTYYKLLEDLHIAGRWHLGEIRTESGHVIDIPYDIDVAFRESLVVELQHDGAPLDFCYTGLGVPVVGPTLERAMRGILEGQATLRPALIAGTKSNVYVLLAHQELACVDEERSEFIKCGPEDDCEDRVGSYRSLSKIVLIESKIPANSHVFRIKGWSVAHIVSAELREAMIDAGCWGARFRELESH